MLATFTQLLCSLSVQVIILPQSINCGYLTCLNLLIEGILKGAHNLYIEQKSIMTV